MFTLAYSQSSATNMNRYAPFSIFSNLNVFLWPNRALKSKKLLTHFFHKKLFCQAWALVSKTVFLFALWQILFELQSCKAPISWLKENCLNLLDKVTGLQRALISLLWTIFWGYLKLWTNKAPHNSRASLIPAICHEVAKIPPRLVKKACMAFRGCIKAVIEADGGWIEWLI